MRVPEMERAGERWRAGLVAAWIVVLILGGLAPSAQADTVWNVKVATGDGESTQYRAPQEGDQRRKSWPFASDVG
jgi:hypothetical protein